MSRLLTDTNALLGQSLGTCTIQHLIGRGGMGAVYLAQQTRPRRKVAVKVLIPALLGNQPARLDFWHVSGVKLMLLPRSIIYTSYPFMNMASKSKSPIS